MPISFFTTAIVVLAGLAYASPTAPRHEDVISMTLTNPVTTPTLEPAALVAHQGDMKAPDIFTLKIVNNAGVDLTTTHKMNNYPATEPVAVPPQGGLPDPGNMPAGATATMLLPTGWGGNIGVNKAGWNHNNADSLIESSYRIQPNDAFAGFSVDISFVDGYTFPIDCFCTSGGGARLKGCSTNLWQLAECPGHLLIAGQGSCRNPLKGNSGLNLTPEPFFAPCQGQAYTYPNDNNAASHGQCQSGTITCQIFPNGL
ncbi:hypothetical protein OQA88_10603 [Cercophora sp. LCS_1]